MFDILVSINDYLKEIKEIISVALLAVTLIVTYVALNNAKVANKIASLPFEYRPKLVAFLGKDSGITISGESIIEPNSEESDAVYIQLSNIGIRDIYLTPLSFFIKIPFRKELYPVDLREQINTDNSTLPSGACVTLKLLELKDLNEFTSNYGIQYFTRQRICNLKIFFQTSTGEQYDAVLRKEARRRLRKNITRLPVL